MSKERFPNTWEELDLLARIRVRQGKLADALKLWGRGATIPTHSSRAHACIASLQNYAAAKFKRDRQMFVVLWALWSTAVFGVVALVVLKGVSMKLELPPPIPAKRASPTKVEPPPRNEASPSVKPLPAVPPPPPPQASPPPIPPALRTPAPSNEKPGKPAEAGKSAERTGQSTPWLFVGLAIMGFGLLMVWVNSSSRTKTVSSNSVPIALL